MTGKKKLNENDVTEKEQDIYDFIVMTKEQMGYPPSVREIAEAAGLKSPSSAQYYLDSLSKKGWIRRDPTKPRALELLKRNQRNSNQEMQMVAVPVIGDVAAGQPILAQQNVESYGLLPETDFDGKGQYLLRVHGNSMINAGILDGDLVVVEACDTAENGEIVVALVDDSATIKRFYKEHGHYRLQPENDAMEPIIVDHVQIQGVVIGLTRSLKRTHRG
mgnify:CR=1 FL=1